MLSDQSESVLPEPYNSNLCPNDHYFVSFLSFCLCPDLSRTFETANFNKSHPAAPGTGSAGSEGGGRGSRRSHDIQASLIQFYIVPYACARCEEGCQNFTNLQQEPP